MTPIGSLADTVVHWQRAHGRSSLPWQNTRDPYRVWLSEIMLQQTQVATVLGYYARFMDCFPDVRALAAASEDAVLAQWSGLGYYSRARNLHKAARTVVAQHGAVFPRTAAQLAQLPGVGRSTAAAIAAFCYGERVAILDANVRRVLARFFAFEQDLAHAAGERALWEKASELVPESEHDMPAYTQGLMDLGAGLCTPRRPACTACPLASACKARQSGEPERFPIRSRKVLRRQETWWLSVLRDPDGRTWLHRRPASGIWAGLYCTPVFADEKALAAHAARLGATSSEALAPVRHALTHRELVLRPVRTVLAESVHFKDPEGAWYEAQELSAIGLPAPLRSLLLRAA